jgi:N6-adenosine-specific RNA methylase IME4
VGKVVRHSRRRDLEPELFDERPIKLEGFVLQSRRVEIVGRPKLSQWGAAFEFATAAEDSSPFWVGDLWNYAEGRPDWKDKFHQEIKRDLSEKTLTNLAYISRQVVGDARDLAPSLSHAGEVAALPKDEQVEWLDRSRTENWSRRELRVELRTARRRRVVEGQAYLEGLFRVIYADPAWIYGDHQPSGSSSRAHYPGMTIEQIAALPVAAHCLPNAVLAMWVTAPLILANPGPREVGEAWGFTYKQQIVWDKVDPAGGNYTQGNHEILTIWTRGSCVPDVQTDLPDSVQTIRKSRVHSQKPEEFRRLLEKHWITGPYLELFGRDQHDGWTVFGNDARLWAREAEAATA